MRINRFFAEILGAKRRNPVWSWGATDPMTNRVFLCVWEDQIETVPDGERIFVARDEPRRTSPGFAERHKHLDYIRNGADGFGVVCTAIDPNTMESKEIDTFDETSLLQLGTFTKEDGRTYARIDARVPVEELTSQRIAHSTLTEDVLIVARQEIESTTKEALVSARVGQGKFRSEVLELWGNGCAVTGSATCAAIRASHIKPWRHSTDEERLDPNNGLPLVASLDALFDAGLIAFASSGTLIVSSVMPKSERQIFGLNSQSLAKPPPQKTALYLAYHRDYVFKK